MKKILLGLWAAILLFLTFFWGYIFAAQKFLPPHFHANFYVFINGKQLNFATPEFMEDVSACKITNDILPNERVHLHNNDGDSIHVHHEGVSWQHFFQNIGFTFENEFIYSASWGIQEYTGDSQAKFVLNGKIVKNPTSKLIHSEDALFIYYGAISDEELLKLANSMPKDAHEYNGKYDPGSCWGTNENAFLVLTRDFFTHIGWAHSH